MNETKPMEQQDTTIVKETKGTLYLIPSLLGGDDTSLIPEHTKSLTCQLDIFIVENVREARRYLVKIGIKKAGKVIDDLVFHPMGKRADTKTFNSYLNAAFEGKSIGLISDAGCPGIADPGAKVVTLAHKRGIKVVPLTGPSSIFLALMSSGMNGQNFAFNGYLPIKRPERVNALQAIEKTAFRFNQSQIFMEAPYRNNHMFQDILRTCQPSTRLCVACNITLPNQLIATKTIQQWKDAPQIDLHKQPTVFILGK
ncbi:MAG: SAM-dependent methyltransferase [Chitinophagales bacterium]